jgi:mono/diheme cytochrome c family protein
MTSRQGGKRVLAVALAGAAMLAAASFAARAQDAPGGTSSVKVSDEGRQVYEQICQACHMADAKGSAGTAGAKIPALAGNPHLADKNYPIMILLKGRGGMPWFTDMLTPAQMAAVITYVRSHFNSYPDPVTEADVTRAMTSPPPVKDCNCGQ